jgi:AcrR family transcriptional regulator
MAERLRGRPRGRPPGAPSPEVRRAQLLDAARSLIRREGAGVSMHAIALAAGVTKPVLSTHFGDRAGLSSALAAEVAADLAHDVAGALHPERTPRRQVRDAIAVFLQRAGL